jgi:hypothetical protein
VLPIISGVKFEADGGKLTLIATDRYTVATYTIDWTEGGDVDVFVCLDSAKALLTHAKGCDRFGRERPGLSLAFDAHTVTAGEANRRVALPLGGEQQFIQWQALVHGHVAGDGVERVGLNPTLLAKFAKAAEKGEVMRLTFGTSPVKPVKVEIGDAFVGVIMPVRIPDNH